MLREFILIAAVAVLCLALSSGAHAGYGGFADEVFFGRHAGAAGAATGRSGVTSSGDIINTFYNPAGLADAKGVGFCFSWTEEDNLLVDGEYRFIGGNIRIGEYGVLGVSRYNFGYSPVGYPAGNGGNRRPVATGASIIGLTLAGEPMKDFLVGVNISTFQYEFTTDRGRTDDKERTYWADIGLLKYFTLGRTQASGHWLKLGGSLSNCTYSGVDLPDGGEDLPVALRLGTAYEMGWWGLTWKRGLRTVETILQVEYQDIVNYEHRTALKLGGEIRIVEVLALRLGYYRETVEDGRDRNSDYIDDTTYGFGLCLPFHKITDGRLPLRLGLDFVNMEPAEGTGSSGADRLATVTFCANYYF